MEGLPPGYESFFGLAARPFSLTPDPKYYFRSRSHGRTFDALSHAIARRESVVLVMGDLGVGKTTLCRTFVSRLERRSRAALVGSSLLSPEDLLRLMLQDLAAVPLDEIRQGRLVGATGPELQAMLNEFLVRLHAADEGAVLIVDEAHSLPPATVEQVVALAALESNRKTVLQVLLAGQPAVSGGAVLPRALDERLATRARLLPLERDECERYVQHRLAVAGGAGIVFAGRTIEIIYALSGGVPRLVNLLCEHALQEAALAGAHHIAPAMIESAAAALELLRLRPRRFRWFGAVAR
jgi:general secretion pathway protein A